MSVVALKIRAVQEWNAPDLPDWLKARASESGRSVASICREVDVSETFWYDVVGGRKSSISNELLVKLERLFGRQYPRQ